MIEIHGPEFIVMYDEIQNIYERRSNKKIE